MTNFWNQNNDDESGEFRDMPDEVNNKNPQVEVAEPAKNPARTEFHSVQEVVEEVLTSEEDEDAENEMALTDARMRLEMGRLYEMVMTSDLFQNMDADPQAVKNVQRGLKRFAKEQMEIMLGMRAQKAPDVAVVSSPFNDLEVEVLKKLASAATKGASERRDHPAQPPVPQAPPKRTSLTPISVQKTKPAVATVQQKLPQKPAAPVQRQAAPVLPKPEPQPEDGQLTKPIEQMTREELEDHNAKIAARQVGRKAALPSNRLPMPSPDQEASIFQMREMDINPVSAITNAIKNSRKQ